MFKVVFKNLEKSDLVRESIQRRFSPVVEKFPQLSAHEITVTLEMENSPHQPGLDSFTVHAMVQGRRFKNLNLERKASNLYVAAADVVDGMLELFHRSAEKRRGKWRKQIRQVREQTLYQQQSA